MQSFQPDFRFVLFFLSNYIIVHLISLPQRHVLKITCNVGKSIKMCLSSLPGLMRALSKMSALLVEARTMTWSVVPIPTKENRVFKLSLISRWQQTVK